VTVASLAADGVPFSVSSHLITGELFAIEVTSVVLPFGIVHLISYNSDAVLRVWLEIYHHVAGLGVSVVTIYKNFAGSWSVPLLTYTLDTPNGSSVSIYVPIAECAPKQNESEICTWKVLCAAILTAQASDVSVALDKQPDNRHTRIGANKRMHRGCVNLQEMACIYARSITCLHRHWVVDVLYIEKQYQIPVCVWCAAGGCMRKGAALYWYRTTCMLLVCTQLNGGSFLFINTHNNGL